VVVDRANVLAGSLLGQTVVPLVSVIDEAGRLLFSTAGGPGKKMFTRLREVLARPTAPGGGAAFRRPTLTELRERLRSDAGDLGVALELATRLGSERKQGEALALTEAVAKSAPGAKAVAMVRADLLLRAGRKDEAISELKRGLGLDPDDYIIRKQIWCIEHPDRFYEGRIDYRWQRQQMRKKSGRAKSDS